MKLSISNIGWEPKDNEQVYKLMQKYGFSGIEIAPTVWIPEHPYEEEQVRQAKDIVAELKGRYGFEVCSMQSILYGRQEKLFGTEYDRQKLYAYTVKAIDYASAIGCRNLVFGCPRNRSIPEDWNGNENIICAIELDFFRKLGDYAQTKGTVLAMEANPPIYNTNYINTTQQALDLVGKMDSGGFLLNLDMGTMIENGEPAEVLEGYVDLISHVHISEPGLKAVEQRRLHRKLAGLLADEGYKGYISIEVGKNNLGDDPLGTLEQMMGYVADIFG